jgi:hypothetical protein
MTLCSAVSQRMAERGVLSNQEAPKSPPEIEPGDNRRKEGVKRTWIRGHSVLWHCQHGQGF